MTITAARDLAQYGIRVVAVAPGVVDTPMMAGFSHEVRAGLAAGVPFPQPPGRANGVRQADRHDCRARLPQRGGDPYGRRPAHGGPLKSGQPFPALHVVQPRPAIDRTWCARSASTRTSAACTVLSRDTCSAQWPGSFGTARVRADVMTAADGMSRRHAGLLTRLPSTAHRPAVSGRFICMCGRPCRVRTRDHRVTRRASSSPAKHTASTPISAPLPTSPMRYPAPSMRGSGDVRLCRGALDRPCRGALAMRPDSSIGIPHGSWSATTVGSRMRTCR
ncbi:hypothetical protein EDD90_2176 [Streptomyces sp. Ag109_O5-1]|nr:hypothetical protein EDD90_2176 [Streptomyces sp. Ag109_O5-1]